MSDELVQGANDELFVITGDPSTGYAVHPVGPPIGMFERKFTARRACRDGTIHATSNDPEG